MPRQCGFVQQAQRETVGCGCAAASVLGFVTFESASLYVIWKPCCILSVLQVSFSTKQPVSGQVCFHEYLWIWISMDVPLRVHFSNFSCNKKLDISFSIYVVTPYVEDYLEQKGLFLGLQQHLGWIFHDNNSWLKNAGIMHVPLFYFDTKLC